MQPLILQYLMSDDLGAGDATLVEGRKAVHQKLRSRAKQSSPAAEEGGKLGRKDSVELHEQDPRHVFIRCS